MNLTLHHIGVLVKSIPESAAFYLQMGYELRSQIIHDPTQTAYVQFLKLPTDRSYLELISPDRPDGRLNNALQKGGGLNHVCYSTNDIDGCSAWLRDTGFFLIAEPVAAVAFDGRRVAWFRGRDRLLVELVEAGSEGAL
uniref:Methylmalonyl-CoA epimerase n=1 Tax=Solibacter usitatus (strain Ellin6076) TaxID=234267 RepID=Q01TN9_SOLUE